MNLYITALVLLLSLSSMAQPVYERQEIMIPMRDGVKLNTVIYTVKNSSEPLPFLFLRTPYGVSKYPSPMEMTPVKDMAKDEYIFVFQDIRGRYKSEGKFEMQRFSRDKNDPKAIDESTDAYDTIDWLLKYIPNNNGRVGMYGVSYNGWTTLMGALDPHPALKAASEQASPSDMWLGDDFHHNGAFRLSYGFEYAFREEAGKTDSSFTFNKYDLYEWYLQLGSLANVNKNYFHNKIPTWNDFVNHPDYDHFWQKQAMAYRLDYPRVPIMHVAGWWDQEDFYGPLKAYEILEKKDSNRRNSIVIGPWYHGSWGSTDGRSLGPIQFDTSTGNTYREAIQARWFAHHLKGKADPGFTEAITFQTGANKWQTYNSWPPKEAVKKKLYLQPGSRLSFTKPAQPTNTNPYTAYVSDPFHPVPYRTRPIEPTYGPGSRWRTWLIEDQRFVHHRPDVLSFETPVLTSDVTVTGQLFAHLFAATTGSDADWVVKLIDVYPDVDTQDLKMSGYQLMVANDVFRGRYRKSFEKPAPIQPNLVNEYVIDLHSIDHVFRKGHKIMVQIQSTWFPIIDRNPQTWVPNIFHAKETDFRKATHSIYHNATYPTYIELPVME